MSKTQKRYKKKTYRKKSSYKKKSIYRKKSTYKKKRFQNMKGSGGTDPCCICNENITTGKPFIPSGCLIKHGKIRSHKICSNCWWDTFAKEGVSHQCPGCVSKKELNGPPPPQGVIDLTED